MAAIALRKIVSVSQPASIVGTTPNAVSPEYLPPTVGSARNTRYPSTVACLCMGESGSVTMKIRVLLSMPAASKAASKLRFCESVSTVEPDFEDTTTTVLLKSPERAARTCEGSVESSTTSSLPAVLAITSGASDDPPMPHSTTLSRPCDASWARSCFRSGIRAKAFFAASTQPRRTADSSSASFPHSVWSFAKMREAMFSLTRSGTNFAMASETRPEWDTFRVI